MIVAVLPRAILWAVAGPVSEALSMPRVFSQIEDEYEKRFLEN